MIVPTEKDIGRKVVYVPRKGKRQDGVITSMNDLFVFVRYGSDFGSKATRRQDLEWASAGASTVKCPRCRVAVPAQNRNPQSCTDRRCPMRDEGEAA